MPGCQHKLTRQQQHVSRQGCGIAQGNGLKSPGTAAVPAAVPAAAAEPAGEAWPGRRACAGLPVVTSAVAASHAAPGSEAPGSQRPGIAWRATAGGPTCACITPQSVSGLEWMNQELQASSCRQSMQGQ